VANARLSCGNPAQAGRRKKAISQAVAIQHHPVFYNFAPHTGPAPAGFEVDFLGCKIRQEFLPSSTRTGVAQNSYPLQDEEYPEWIDVLESVVSARGSYTFIELGAGFARWSARAAQAVRQFSGLPFHLVAVEAEPRHFQWLGEHLRDNGIDPGEHTLIQAAVSATSGDALFYIGLEDGKDQGPAEWYGQCVAKKRDGVLFGGGEYLGLAAQQHRSGCRSVRVATVTLQEILRDLEQVDLVDLDVQGEELEVISSAIDEVSRCVKRLHIETHGRRIDQGLRRLLPKFGWRCLAEYKCYSEQKTPWGRVHFTGGVQSWVNPRLAVGGGGV